MFDLNENRKKLLSTSGHMLILGGPGSGKTTMALLKALHEIQGGILKPRQKILFLSFARSTIARILEQAKLVIASDKIREIRIETYHGFTWSLLKSHGYLISTKRNISLLPPPEAASLLAEIENPTDRASEKNRLFDEKGILHFDLFAEKTTLLLSKSQALTKIISDTYPIIILDEFQDTNLKEWEFIQELGKYSRLIALADAEQRIYEFRGADPYRIGQFIEKYNPEKYDFGSENNRSLGKDITEFGNDLLTNKHKTKKYKDVKTLFYKVMKGDALHLELKSQILAGIQYLTKEKVSDWSLAILVPTKQLMLDVSNYLAKEQTFKSRKTFHSLVHEVALDTAGPSLAAVLIGGLLENINNQEKALSCLVQNLSAYLRGRNGGDKTPSKANLATSKKLDEHLAATSEKNKETKILKDCRIIISLCLQINFSGDPGKDWLMVRSVLEHSSSKEIASVAEDAKYLRLLNKGAVLRARLGELWRATGTYTGAANVVKSALVQEHFSSSTRELKGIQVMTIHKSKGKEFDYVVLYEGAYNNRYLRTGATASDLAQSILAMRVAVTRAKKNVVILTPKSNPSPLLE